MSTLPNHHLPESVLLEYASGTLSEAVALLVATHLALCPLCREFSHHLDAVGGAILESGEEAIGGGVLDALLSRLDDAVDEPLPEPVVRYDGVIPMPLRQMTGPFNDLKWRPVAPGIWKVSLPVFSGGRQGALVHLRGGLRIPRHQHLGTERTLVLAGGFTDEVGAFAPGDLCLRQADDGVHKQFIDRGAPCIALAIDDATKAPVSRLGRMVNRLFDA